LRNRYIPKILASKKYRVKHFENIVCHIPEKSVFKFQKYNTLVKLPVIVINVIIYQYLIIKIND